jgi:hypothetical protein
LNREAEKRSNKLAMISDLRSSGAIEQDADWIQVLYRDEYYNNDSLIPGEVVIITGKNRGDEVGADYLNWRGEYNLLEGLPEGGFVFKSAGVKSEELRNLKKIDRRLVAWADASIYGEHSGPSRSLGLIPLQALEMRAFGIG